jgi:hypothetical protein
MNSVTDKARVSPEEMLKSAWTIAETAKEMGVTLRIAGGIGVLEVVESEPDVFAFLLKHRSTAKADVKFVDIDMAGYSKETKKINEVFMGRLHFAGDKIVNSLFGDTRRIYYDPTGAFHVDIFLDKLDFNHQIDFRGRLELEYPNLNYPDLLLSKLQIHQTNEKDLLDILALLSVAGRRIPMWKERILRILTDDWGFYYDSIRNLEHAGQQARAMLSGSSDDEVVQKAKIEVAKLRGDLESAPKTKKWYKRMKKGTEKQWWKDVEDVFR